MHRAESTTIIQWCQKAPAETRILHHATNLHYVDVTRWWHAQAKHYGVPLTDCNQPSDVRDGFMRRFGTEPPMIPNDICDLEKAGGSRYPIDSSSDETEHDNHSDYAQDHGLAPVQDQSASGSVDHLLHELQDASRASSTNLLKRKADSDLGPNNNRHRAPPASFLYRDRESEHRGRNGIQKGASSSDFEDEGKTHGQDKPSQVLQEVEETALVNPQAGQSTVTSYRTKKDGWSVAYRCFAFSKNSGFLIYGHPKSTSSKWQNPSSRASRWLESDHSITFYYSQLLHRGIQVQRGSKVETEEPSPSKPTGFSKAGHDQDQALPLLVSQHQGYQVWEARAKL